MVKVILDHQQFLRNTLGINAIFCPSTRAPQFSLLNLNPISFNRVAEDDLDSVTISLVVGLSFTLCNVTWCPKNVFVKNDNYQTIIIIINYDLLYTYCKAGFALSLLRTLLNLLFLVLYEASSCREWRGEEALDFASFEKYEHYRTVLQYIHT